MPKNKGSDRCGQVAFGRELPATSLLSEPALKQATIGRLRTFFRGFCYDPADELNRGAAKQAKSGDFKPQ